MRLRKKPIIKYLSWLYSLTDNKASGKRWNMKLFNENDSFLIRYFYFDADLEMTNEESTPFAFLDIIIGKEDGKFKISGVIFNFKNALYENRRFLSYIAIGNINLIESRLIMYPKDDDALLINFREFIRIVTSEDFHDFLYQIYTYNFLEYREYKDFSDRYFHEWRTLYLDVGDIIINQYNHFFSWGYGRNKLKSSSMYGGWTEFDRVASDYLKLECKNNIWSWNY